MMLLLNLKVQHIIQFPTKSRLQVFSQTFYMRGPRSAIHQPWISQINGMRINGAKIGRKSDVKLTHRIDLVSDVF